jgi:hypothetical protein
VDFTETLNFEVSAILVWTIKVYINIIRFWHLSHTRLSKHVFKASALAFQASLTLLSCGLFVEDHNQ